MDLLELLEGLDNAQEIVDKINANAKSKKVKILIDDGGETPKYIPKYRLDDEIEKKKLIQDQLDNADKTIKKLQKELKDKEDALQDIDTYKQENEKLKKQISNIEKTRAIQESVNGFERKAKDVNDLIDKFLDLEKIEIKDGKAIGVEEQLKELVKSKEYLFEPVKGGTGDPGNPGKGNKGTDNNESIGAKLAKMSAETQKNAVEAQNKFFS